MPALSDLKPNQPTMILWLAFGNGGPRDVVLRRHFVNLIRLTDLSAEEYELARQHLNASMSNDNGWRLGNFLSGSDHLELCIITLRRAFNALQVISRDQKAPAIDRIVRRALESFDGVLGSARNAVVHVEEAITRGEIQVGETQILEVDADGRAASIGKHKISLEGLGGAIRRLHGVAAQLSAYREG